MKQQNVGGRYWVARVDFSFPPLTAVIELDGRRYHTALLDKEHDRLRDIELVRAGRQPIRLTWHDLKKRRLWVVEVLTDLVRPLLANAA